MRPTGKRYFELKAENVLTSLNFGPNGSWYDVRRPASLRGQEVTVARAQGDELVVLKPLLGRSPQAGMQGYRMVRESEILRRPSSGKEGDQAPLLPGPFWAQP